MLDRNNISEIKSTVYHNIVGITAHFTEPIYVCNEFAEDMLIRDAKAYVELLNEIALENEYDIILPFSDRNYYPCWILNIAFYQSTQ